MSHPFERPLLAALLLSVSFVLSIGCSSDPLNCEEAAAVLSGCESTDQKGCADDDEAASLILSCSNDTKSDLFGNSIRGEACTWNWQCKGDENFTCIDDICFLRNTEGNRCDEGDDSDCKSGLVCADDLSVPNNVTAGICSTTTADVVPALYAETVRPNENLQHESNASQIVGMILQTALDRLNGDSVKRRFVHAKMHSCVRANFTIDDDIPSDFQVGPVFETASRSFDAWVRFSNGSILLDPDEDAALLGLAIKLLGVEGAKVSQAPESDAATQDFLTIDLPATPTTDANEFVELTRATFNGLLSTAAYAATHPRVILRALSLSGDRGEPSSARLQTYWGGGAYKFGDKAMKYVVKPCAGASSAAEPVGNDYIRNDLVAAMRDSETCYDFYIQLQTDSLEESIEDSSVIWDPAKAPEQHVARLIIPVTDLEAAGVIADADICDDFSFNIWNSAAEYQPIGHTNRGRRTAYQGSKTTREASAEPQ